MLLHLSGGAFFECVRNACGMLRGKTALMILVLLMAKKAISQAPFIEVSSEVGINHAFQVDLATFGGGAAVLDYDNDGYEDLYVTGGRSEDKFYRNNGDGTFTNILEEAGFSETKEVYTQGASSADVNKDGFRDLIITTFFNIEDRQTTHNLLYLNLGNGQFREVSATWGLVDHVSNSQGATFGDLNGDGYPDLYVSNYFSNSLQGISIFNEETIVNTLLSATDFIFINAGGERFIEVSDIYGMQHDGFGFQGLLTDYDNDGDLDLYIANDFGFRRTPNLLLENTFPQSELIDRSINLALNQGMNAMGMASSDNNNDGLLDYFVSNLAASLLVVNQGEEFPFFNNTVGSGVGINTIEDENFIGPPVSWGCNFFDFDHDTDSDLFVNNGALNPTVRLNPNFFFEYENGRYVEKAAEMGLNDYRIGRGSVVFDYDNDGDMDLFVVNQMPRDPNRTLPEARCLFYRNDNENGNWLKVKLSGNQSDRDGIGSRVEVMVNGRRFVKEIDGGSSHLSQNSTIAHFGLDNITSVDSITVNWLGGGAQVVYDIDVNQLITIEEENSEIDATETVEAEISAFPTYFDNDLTVRFTYASDRSIQIEVHDEKGNLVDTIENEASTQGEGFINWLAPPDLPRGVYFFSIKGKGNKVITRAIKR